MKLTDAQINEIISAVSYLIHMFNRNLSENKIQNISSVSIAVVYLSTPLTVNSVLCMFRGQSNHYTISNIQHGCLFITQFITGGGVSFNQFELSCMCIELF